MENNIFGISEQEGVLLSKERNNPCYDQVLKKENFLSEFYTKSEKQQALKNLGVFNEMEFVYNRFNDYLKKEKLGDNPTNIDNIAYYNRDYPELKNLRQVIDYLLYNRLTVSINITPNIAEIGDTIQNVVVSWKYNREIDSQTLYSSEYPGGLDIDKSTRSITINGATVQNSTFKIVGSDGKETAEGTASINFVPGIYYGSADEQPKINSLEKVVLPSRQCTVTIQSDTQQELWFFIPQSYGNPIFTVNGNQWEFTNDGTIEYNSIIYNIFSSVGNNWGSAIITIS